MKTTDRLLEANAIGRASALLEQLNTRLAAGSRGWREKQKTDWETLRQIANQMIARQELLETPESPQPELPAVNQ